MLSKSGHGGMRWRIFGWLLLHGGGVVDFPWRVMAATIPVAAMADAAAMAEKRQKF